MKLIIRLQRGEPGDPGDAGPPIALATDQAGNLLGGWELTEPWVEAHFRGRPFAFFEAELLAPGNFNLLRPVPDPDW